MQGFAVAVMAAAFFAIAPAAPAHAAASYPEGFSERVLASGLESPTAVDWAPDGRMFIVQKAGQLKVKDPNTGAIKQVLDLGDQVNHASDRGLLGVAVDEGFATNRYVYLLYTYDVGTMIKDDGTPTVSQLMRVVVNPDNTVGERKVILGTQKSGACPAPSNTSDCIPSDGLSHSIGTIRSDPRDGTLWVGSGDAASFSRVDQLAYRTYDERSLAGKILHIDREGRGVAGNPFCPTNPRTDNCAKIYAKGFRNPFRFQLRPGGGLVIGDVGWNSREEVNLVRSGGGNYGWPCYEGRQRTPGYRDSATCAAEYAKEGSSQASVVAKHDYSREFGSTAVGGPTYEGTSYPSEYRGKAFFGDYSGQTIRHLVLDGDDNVMADPPFATGRTGLVDLVTAPSGNLALMNIGQFGNDGQVVELVYQSRQPVALATATPTSGTTPLNVAFRGSGSSDPDGDSLRYAWDFGDGNTSTAADPSHVYTRAGNFTAKLTVTDPSGNADSAEVLIRAGQSAPAATIAAPANGAKFRIGRAVQLSGSGKDSQGRDLAPSQLSWRVLLHHNTHVHDVTQLTGADASFNPIADHDADSYYEVILTATDPASGLTGTRTVYVEPEAVQARLESTPTGAPLSYAGRDVRTPYSAATTIGFRPTVTAAEQFTRSSDGRSFYFAGWADAPSNWDDADPRIRDDVTVPSSDFTLHALYEEDKAELREATASSIEAPDQGWGGPEAAVDGNPYSRYSSRFADNEWWQVDLGKARTVSRVRVDWEESYGRQYAVQTSDDGVNFSTAATQTLPLGSPPGVVTTPFAPRNARYVRLRLDTRATPHGFSFWDVKVLGPEDTSTAPETTITSGPAANATINTKAPTFGFLGTGAARFDCRVDNGTWATCTSPRQLSGLAEGPHTFQARGVNSDGVVDATPASRTFTVDTVAPETTLGLAPAEGSTIRSKSTSIAFSGELGGTFECSLDGAAYAECTSPWDLDDLGDGQHTIRVRAKDAGGNVDATPATRSFRVDTTPPDTTITSGPNGPVASTSPAFAFNGETGGSFDCKIDNGSWEPCTSPKQYTSLGQGDHNFSVRAKDTLGNTDATPATRSFAVDTVGPDTSFIVAPAAGGTITTSYTDVSFTSPEMGATFECSLDGAVYAGCTSPWQLTGLGDGQHTIGVRAKDALGNADATAVTRTFSVDSEAPTATITSGPSGWHTATTATFGFTGEAGGTLECSLDGVAFAACTSTRTYSNLSQASHTFAVRAKDAAGNTGPAASRTFTVDSLAPAVTISSGPNGPVASTSASFGFAVNEQGATLRCSMDNPAPASLTACTSPATYPGLGQGAHTFRLQAIDRAGNVSAVVSRGFSVDTEGPTATITGGPSNDEPIGSSSTSFSFTGEAGGSFECKLDGAAYAGCASPRQLTGMNDGRHTFKLRAKDALGNPGAEITRSFTVDTREPATTIGTTTHSGTGARFEFNSPDAARYECSLNAVEPADNAEPTDEVPFTGCDSPKAYTQLADGSYTFRVRGINAAGVTESTPAEHAFTIDTTPPQTTILGGPSGSVAATSATFELSGEPGASFECQLDDGGWETCTSPKTYANLGRGSHTFRARAKDAAGNVDVAPAERTFVVDAPEPPTPPASSSPGSSPAPATPRPTPTTPSGTSPKPTKKPPRPRKTYASMVMRTRGLKAMFGLGDASRRNATDAKRGHPGRFRGSPKRAKSLTGSGRDELARAFDGKDDRIDLDPRSLGASQSISVEAWVKAARQRRGTVVAIASNPASDGLTIGIDQHGRLVVQVADSRIVTRMASKPLGTRRHHVAVTYDGSRLGIYVDGRLTHRTRHSGGIAWKNGRTAAVGALANGRSPFKGTLDELALYDRALSASAVKAHYTAGR